MTSLVIFALPLLTAVAAWQLFLHLARSGRQVRYEPWWQGSTNVDAEAMRRAVEAVQAMRPAFAQMAVAASQASFAFNEFGRVLREANERATKARASGREDA